jgi:hypothetical protein
MIFAHNIIILASNFANDQEIDIFTQSIYRTL